MDAVFESTDQMDKGTSFDITWYQVPNNQRVFFYVTPIGLPIEHERQ